jgi:hypothetical protein
MLPPSLESRVHNILTWVARLRRLCRIETLSMELVLFDTQLMENAEISGVEVRRVTRHGIPDTVRKNLRGGSWVSQLT